MKALLPSNAAGRQRVMRNAMPIAIFLAISAVALSLPLWSDSAISSFSVFNTVQNASTLGLLALGVGLTIVIGEFDLSSVAMFTFGGLLAVRFGEAQPLLGIAIAMAAGGSIGLLQGHIMSLTGISSVPLTLGGYIVLLGLCHIVAGEGILAYANYEPGLWLDAVLPFGFSPRSLIVLAIFVAVWGTLRWTKAGIAIRATGADRRAANASGLSTAKVVTAVFSFSGVCCALGGALFAYSTTAAKYDLGLDPFIAALTAILVGGVDIRGGRGSAMGILLGVMAMSLLDTIFLQLAMPTYLADLLRGGLLLAIVMLQAPDLAVRLVRWRNAAKQR